MKIATIGRILTYGLTLFCLSCSIQAMDALRFDFATDLPLDPRATAGRLDNGLTYFILPNGEPPGRVSLRLIVGVGSLMERADERGLAHYLEHIAFCGSRHFSQGDLIECLQRMGVKFGRHSNAYTSFGETVYKLDLPHCDRTTVKKGLEVLRDFLTELNLDGSEIDRERGVILAEKRSQDSVNYRHFVAQTGFLYPNSILPLRLPIGEEDTIRAIDGGKMRRFYGAFYGPNNAALVLVGDVSPVDALDWVRSAFDNARPIDRPTSYDLGNFGLSGTEFLLHSDPEMAQASVEIFCLEEETIEDSEAARRDQLIADLAGLMLTRRLEALSRREDSPLIDGGAGFDFDCRRGLRLGWLVANCEHEKIFPALQAAEQELRRAMDYGFTDAEVSRGKAILMNRFENGLRMEPTRRNDWFADGWVSQLVDGRRPTSAQWAFDFAERTLAPLGREEINGHFRRLWQPHNRRIMIAGKLPKGCTEGAIKRAYRRSAEELLKAPDPGEVETFDYVFQGNAPILSRQNLAGGPIVCCELANGIRLNLMPTDFERGQVLIRLRFGRGSATETGSTFGLHHFAAYGFLEGGLGKYPWETIRDLFAGKSCSIDFDVTDSAFILSGQTTAKDLQSELDLLAAYVTDPGFRPDGEREAQKAIFQLNTTVEHTPEGILASQADRFLHSGDRRYGYEPFDRLRTFSMDDLRSWMAGELADGPMEISLVGDFDMNGALRGLVRTFGSLPSRSFRPLEKGAIALPLGQRADFSFESQIPKAIVQLILPTGGYEDFREKWKFDLLADLISDRARIKLRKEMGESYSPHGQHFASRALRNYGYIGITALVEPAKIGDLSFALKNLLDDLKKNGITEDEFRRIRDPFLSQLRDDLRRNRYWLNLIDGLQSDPERAPEIQALKPQFFERLTVADLEESLAKIEPEEFILIRIKPANGEQK